MSVQKLTKDAPPQPFTAFLSDKEVAHTLRTKLSWVRSHAHEIPGFTRIGAKYRFSRRRVESWLGSLEPLMLAEDIAALVQMSPKWIYANEESLVGLLRLGRYVRFRPAEVWAYLNGTASDEPEVVQ